MKARHRYEFIHSRRDKWPVKTMCRVLEVSESGYYRFLKSLGKPDKDAVLSAAIMDVIADSEFNDNYGVPRMQLALAFRGHRVGIRRLKRLMRNLGLIHERKRRPKGLTKATTEIQKKENLIKMDFSADQPYTERHEANDPSLGARGQNPGCADIYETVQIARRGYTRHYRGGC